MYLKLHKRTATITKDRSMPLWFHPTIMFRCNHSKIFWTIFFFASCQIRYFEFYLRKQSLGGILYKMCSKKFRKIYRKTPVPESLFNKVAALSLQLYQKGNSGADVFLWVLRNSKEHLFLQTLSPPATTVAASLSLENFFSRNS